MDRVNLPQIIIVKIDVERVHVLLKLHHRHRPDDGRGEEPPRLAKSMRERHRAHPVPPCHLLILLRKVHQRGTPEAHQEVGELEKERIGQLLINVHASVLLVGVGAVTVIYIQKYT